MSNETNQPKKQIATSSNELNKLRAAVLGANDGIVSTAGLVLGVAGSGAAKEAIFIAGIAGLASGALSMAAGEFVSVSSQRDSEEAFLRRKRRDLSQNNTSMTAEITEHYRKKGLSKKTAALVANELAKNGTLRTELEKESGLDPDDVSNPWAAATASALSFTAGSLIPLLAIAIAPEPIRVWTTVVAVFLSLILTGTLSARAGKANKTRAALRIVIWGVGAMAATYAIGHFVGTSLG